MSIHDCAICKMFTATERFVNTGPQLFIKGKLSPPRSTRPKKITNSEKTITTKNRSQQNYLLKKRKLQLDTQAALLSDCKTEVDCRASDSEVNPTTSSPNVDYEQSKLPAVAGRQSSSRACNSRASYHNCSDWENEWYTLYHHFTDYNKECENSTSCVNHSYLSKLVTNIKLSPKAISRNNEARLSGENSHSEAPNDSKSTQQDSRSDQLSMEEHLPTSLPTSHHDSIPELLVTGPSESNMEKCRPMSVCTEHSSLDLLSPPRPSRRPRSNRTRISSTKKLKRQASCTSAPSLSYLQPLSEMHQQFRRMSEPSSLTKSLTRSNAISRRSSSPTTVTSKAKFFEDLKSAKRNELQSTHHPLLDTETLRPRSYWYEMKTPEFHVEAKRNIEFLRKNCNW